jgi:septal ring factor EnvC (AmiA/AmiB activator)
MGREPTRRRIHDARSQVESRSGRAAHGIGRRCGQGWRPRGARGGHARPRFGSDTPAAKDPRIADLDSQIKALRDQFHSQLDPLEAQVKSLREKFDPQLAALEDQRRDLVEASKPPEVRALDDQETAELKQLGDQEKSEVEKVRQRFADERKEVQAKYNERRQELTHKK